MEKQIVTEKDYELLEDVASLQHALVVSSANPVCLWKRSEGADFDIRYPGMYYDACAHEDLAKSTIRKRIDTAKKDIKEHYKLHKSFLDFFLKMDSAIVKNNREGFSELCDGMCDSVFDYIDLVKQHKERLGEDSFLFYPYCPPGHYFYILNGNKVGYCLFNTRETYEEAGMEVRAIKNQLSDFKKRPEKIPYIHLLFSEKDGAGLVDMNFEQGIRTNQLSLERAGLKLKD
jgi:hypothetical protein